MADNYFSRWQLGTEAPPVDNYLVTRDPIREYMIQQWRDAIGDAGANAGKAALSGGVAFGTGNPALGTLLALGFGGRAVGDVLRSGRYSGAADAFRRTGLPGAPTGPQLPLDEDPMLGVGRFADPRLKP